MLSPPRTDPAARQVRFEAVYAANHVSILGYALRRTTCPDDAADILAETFLTAWRRLDELSYSYVPPELTGETARLAEALRRLPRAGQGTPHACRLGVRASTRRPPAGRGMIERDFAFHVNSAANKLRNSHDHGPGRRAAGTIRAERARGPECAVGKCLRRVIQGPSGGTRARRGPQPGVPAVVLIQPERITAPLARIPWNWSPESTALPYSGLSRGQGHRRAQQRQQPVVPGGTRQPHQIPIYPLIWPSRPGKDQPVRSDRHQRPRIPQQHRAVTRSRDRDAPRPQPLKHTRNALVRARDPRRRRTKGSV
jgi:hypothetical protein